MKLKVVILSLLLFTSVIIHAQAKESKTFPLVVQFASFCCGVPSDTTIIKYVSCFKKNYKVKTISAYKIGPMGREGEYYLAFPLDELSKKQADKFIKEIECVKIAKEDNGAINYEKNFTINNADFSRSLKDGANVIKF